MELRDAVRPERVEYRGQGAVAGSQLTFAMGFQLSGSEVATQVSWQGEVAVDGMLALLAGSTIDELGRRNLDMMAEQLQNKLRGDTSTGVPAEPPSSDTP
jgi:carbon monoxide dehydrogenase subunit G